MGITRHSLYSEGQVTEGSGLKHSYQDLLRQADTPSTGFEQAEWCHMLAMTATMIGTSTQALLPEMLG
jgi:hypothetical protein